MGKVLDKLWEAESKLPDSVRVHTDKLIRGGSRVAKRIKPFREDTRRRGQEWAIRHTGGLLGREKKRK